MADTPRTINDLKAILADNMVRGISPQDIRDFLVSCVNIVEAGLQTMAGSLAVTEELSAGDGGFTVDNAGSVECSGLSVTDVMTVNGSTFDVQVEPANFGGGVQAVTLSIGSGNLLIENSGNIISGGNLSFDGGTISSDGNGAITVGELTVENNITAGQGGFFVGDAEMYYSLPKIFFNALPLVDPEENGRLWNNSGTMRISAG
jgi:hypothetical protein